MKVVMIAIGFRVSPQAVYWAVARGTLESPILVSDGKFSAPKTYTDAASLTWYRERVLATVAQYKATVSAIRFPESFSSRSGLASSTQVRLRIEGVILEALNAAACEIRVAGSTRHIESKLQADTPLKEYMDQADIRGINWNGKAKELKEAILVAVAALGDSE